MDTRRSRRTVRSGRSVVFAAGTPQVTGSVEDLGEVVGDADGVSRDAEFQWMARAIVRGAFGSLPCSRCPSLAASGGSGEEGGPAGSSVYSGDASSVYPGDASSVYSGDPGFGGVGFGEPSPASRPPTSPEHEPADGMTSDVGGQEQGVESELAPGGEEGAPGSEPEVEEKKSTPRPSTPARTSSPITRFPSELKSTAEGGSAGEEAAVVPKPEEGGAASPRRFPLIPTDPH
ncbi:hypothetical protein B0T18DRAFT_155074 [Schizothecium vesticola]|uniref:Uncharacterized protein n=1 Tax=Schizothecium vesticola TaxID=314040 RepID=A0AA40EWD4_9PEZI|nr:hypothetical protein B0T18DRAFT_155074 [Schizothecium vesticola]